MKIRKKLMVSIISFLVVMIGLFFNRFNEVENFSSNIKADFSLTKPVKFKSEQVSNDWKDIQSAQDKALDEGINKNAYGIIKISSIDLNLPIFRGANDLTLSLGSATFLYDNAEAGKGNLVLAGHTTPYSGILFTNLHQIEKGTRVTVDTSDKSYTYEIDSISSASVSFKTQNGVPENKVLRLPEKNEKAKITLITCTAWNDSNTRLIVSGHLV